MTDHLDGEHVVVSIRGSNSAYFLSVKAGEELDAFLSRRDDMGREDRSDFYKFQELCGRWTRIAIDELESVYLSTPAIRKKNDDMNAELKARSIAAGD